MLKDVIIVNPENLEKIKKNILKEGKEKIHVLTDFDRTFTKGLVKGQKAHTVIAQIRQGKYLTLDYAKRAHALADKYYPIEIDPNIPKEEKSAKMVEWWTKHFELLVECGLNKDVMKEIVKTKTLKFRKGALEFLDFLYKHDIPLVMMSAAPGDMIEMYLEQEGRLYDNIHIIADFYEFDKAGKAIKHKEPLIHSLNKKEIVVKGFPIFDWIKDRKNVILIGDSLDDVGMIEGFEYDNLIKIGFLNYDVEEKLENYKYNYDVVIVNDSDMGFVNGLFREIIC